MNEGKCDKHLEACKDCDLSKQVSASDKILLEKIEENLKTVTQTDGTFRLETHYTFLKDPTSTFAAESSNFSTAKSLAERTFGKLIKEKGEVGKEEI